MKNLVVCIGNIARGDDGAAHEVAALLTGRRLAEDTKVMTCHDLDVALVADVAEVDTVVFVDAMRRSAPAVTQEPVEPGPGVATGHAMDPSALLGVSRALYGRAPKAVLFTLAAPDMGHGEGLSACASDAAGEAASAIAGMLSQP